MTIEAPSPVQNLRENLKDVKRLMAIHKELTGDAQGRRYGVEVLNKSAAVLLTACWEALVEDVASQAFDYLLDKAPDSSSIPKKVRALAAAKLKSAADETKIWDLSGDGWQDVLLAHRDKTIEKFVDSLNTPRAKNVDGMFEAVLGIKSMSKNWYWTGMSNKKVIDKLDDYVTDRGAIAHRVQTSKSITKKYVEDYASFVLRLTVKTSNAVNNHIGKIVDSKPWPAFKMGNTK